MVITENNDISDKWTPHVFHPRPNFYETVNNETSFNLSFDVEEGVKIVSRFHLIGKKNSTIMFFHGNGEVSMDYDGEMASSYNNNGMNLFVTDYRGYGESNGIPSYRNMLKDSKAMFEQFSDYLKKNKFTGSLFAMGRSLGSAPAIELASNYPEHLKGLIIESGFSNTYDLLRKVGVPPNLLDPVIEKQYSNCEKIKHVKLPLLVIHGENDFIIPFQDGQELYHSCGVQENKKQLLMIKNAGHNDIWFTGKRLYLNAVIDFINKFSL
ncbi:MAG: alpha/beta hydrolase [Candidatus Hodarchaeales archaeon]|jgi:pimeloyl-ACP methyl ester carboxylesterase